jgi:phosphatidylinositol glycan class B
MAANPPAPPERDRQFLILAALLLAAAAVPRFWAAWIDQGLFWPDEIFQSLEQAHRLVFGYGVVPWEFRLGARSWVFPGVIGGLLKLGDLAGLSSGRSLVLLVKTTMALVSLGGIYLSMRLAYVLVLLPRRQYASGEALAGRRAALLAGAFGGFFSVSLLLGSRCSAEMVSGPLLLAVVILSARSGRARQLAAGALAGFCIHLRYQNGLIALGIPAIMLSDRRFKDALEYSAAAALFGLLGGLLDWFTWGKPFHALLKYVWFNLKKSAYKFGAYPFSYYAKVAWTANGPAILVIVAGLALSVRRTPKLSALVIAYVLVHCLVPHKEFRFLMPIVPLALTLAAVGLADALGRVRYGAPLGAALALVCAASMGWFATRLTWEKLGFPSDRGARSPWHSGEGINRLLWTLGETPDVCGVIVTGESFGWIGGYSYFHRDVNMYPNLGPDEQRAANYLIALADTPAPRDYRRVGEEREFALYRRDGTCGAAPAAIIPATSRPSSDRGRSSSLATARSTRR